MRSNKLRKLNGNNPYEMVSNATGELAAKLQSLITRYAEDSRVFELSNQFIGWWYLPFDQDKDRAGRTLWDKADKLMETLEKEYGGTSGTTSTATSTPMSTSPLEKAGDTVGRTIGTAAGVTIRTGTTGAVCAHQWIKDRALPATKAGGREFWKGLKATGRATRESYKNARAPRPHEDDEVPY